jgi:predicted unusual protein kinase regulating ubiquinone biosynthesis (AarF/ABC1/UbiB family)
VRALLDAALAFVRRSSSGAAALASLAGVIDVEAVPRAYRARVARELDAAVAAEPEPIPFDRVARELAATWRSPPGAVLDALEPEPLAVSASAQVHRGELDGRAVAVKLRRPGLAAAVRSDLALVDALAPPLARVFRALDSEALLRAARERALDDLDLEHAAATQRRLGRAARRLEGVHVSAVRTELASPGVLVAQLLDGPTLAVAAPADPGAVARALVAFHLGAPRAAGLAPVDPRPDHVVLLGDGGIGLLGTGAAAGVDRARFAAFLDALGALREEDRAAFVAAVGRMRLLPADAAAAAYAIVDEVVGELLRGPVRLDAGVLCALTERALAALPDALPLVARLTPEPYDLGPLRMLVQLASLLGRLEATEDWCALALAAGSGGWD